VQAWRARSSAVLTGVGTVLADDPRLDVRLAPAADGERRQPLRVVLDAHLRTPAGARLFSTGGEVLILTALASLDESRAAALSAKGARVESLPAAGGRLELPAVLDRLGNWRRTRCWWRRATLAGEWLRGNLVDEVLLYVAPKLLGLDARGLVDVPALKDLKDALTFALLESQPVGADLRLRLAPAAATPR
jgi:diaminohydroxyphosphoribosylaminopyrimidine deaminase/5-amino-6-(5-phosphoribosylamino)uracil reductase